MNMEKLNRCSQSKFSQTRQFLKFQKKKKSAAVFLGLILSAALAVTCVTEAFAETIILKAPGPEIPKAQETPMKQENPQTREMPQDQPNFSLYAKSAVLMDAENGRVLYEKNGYEHMPNASTTKIMTCILALEQGDLESEVKVSSYAASMPQVRLGMSKEDSFLLKDLLYSLMLESHNDSAAAIAEHIGGSVEGFAAKMNQKARELGCKDTYFITPAALPHNSSLHCR